MLTTVAERAFRYQGVSEKYIQTLLEVYQAEKEAGKNMEQAVVEPLTAILSSPSFLYVKEKNDGKRSELSQEEFAIRLSYFLWASPPDEELYTLAKKEKLYDARTLSAQFKRMIDSPKADAFLENFINQWAEMDRFDEIDLPVSLIRSKINQSLRREVSEYFKVLVRENHSVNTLIDSDFVVINNTLAGYYRIRENLGAEFEKVRLPKNSERGGILSQAGFLITGSTGERTSPTIRGTLIREKFLNDPPPPPPPNIPMIDPPKGSKFTVRELVDQHMNVAQCASCHQKIDPIGFGLENFDHLGKWRIEEIIVPAKIPSRRQRKRGITGEGTPAVTAPVISKGSLNEEAFQGFAGLKKVLLSHNGLLAESLYESLLSYGVGRQIDFVDEKEIQTRLNALKKKDYPLQEMLYNVVSSDAFKQK